MNMMFNLLPHELIIDNFAGGGGTSTGLEQAFGRPVDVAINHDPKALAMHRANHPETKHYCESVWDVDPIEVTGNQPVGLVWLSPDCKHFSKAKGGKPVEKKIRGLAWVALRWAAKTRPRVIMLENVEEFKTWGRLADDGKPCPRHKGETFNSFVKALRHQGYQVEWRELKACDFGAPTIRKRFFLIARRDGLPIVWPKPTHADPESKAVKTGKLLPWRTAAECIDWSIPCPSIFERKNPLAEATCKRIATGIMRYVVNNPNPFIVKSNHTASYYKCFRGQQINEPLQTITSAPGFSLVIPFLAGAGGPKYSVKPTTANKPIGTLVASGNYKALISPVLVKFRFNSMGENIQNPLPTITAGSFIKRPGGAGHALGICVPQLVGPVLTECSNASSPRCMPINEPIRTICAQTKGGHHALIAPSLVVNTSGHHGNTVYKPLHTIATGGHHAVVSAFLAKNYTGVVGSSMHEPVHTVTAKDHNSLVTGNIVKLRNNNIGHSFNVPLHTVTASGGHFAQVCAFLTAFYGNEKDGNSLNNPLRTVTAKERFGLVTVEDQLYQIADIGFRMLQPVELYKAQGFPESYIFSYGIDEYGNTVKLTKTEQNRMVGNSVPLQLSRSLVMANFAHESKIKGAA
ncbi:DNA cytosine methyltransferase [uncultured Acinetobacter sp.]|uniref:DNA cytosine methyltransferase n=1 Tax=uncultured Acinetobacter sp. TaxID=165433 RepID=UPI00258F3E1A|nr:DNA cytosine methyltransferase [uncultured Acinetobacter sp.]